ncbi:hypothetical protein [Glacieibacterium frigidum]|uniref:Uncharacterized protein n=1 Tax=Glacieibacterium frigidum TaxID=2593303 RepID=A0A552UFS5_9SPHN|nr:hypothetical protein [Glacieibacterium frigidum]TRW17054.1 hypothetical protein FMM06_02265 [Glacieibacterium frigidum]
MLSDTATLSLTGLLAYVDSHREAFVDERGTGGLVALHGADLATGTLQFTDGVARLDVMTPQQLVLVLDMASTLGARVRDDRFETLIAPDTRYCHLDDATYLRTIYLAQPTFATRVRPWLHAVLIMLGTLVLIVLASVPSLLQEPWLRPMLPRAIVPEIYPEASGPVVARPAQPGPAKIVILVLPDFNPDLAARLGAGLGAELREAVAVESAQTGTLDGFEGQVDASDIVTRLAGDLTWLREAHPGSLVIVLTNADINNRAWSTRFLFSVHFSGGAAPWSVVSGRRLYTMNALFDRTLVESRLEKLLLRAVGEQLRGLSRTTDPSDLMYAPLLSATDIDRLEGKLPPAP